MDDNATIGARLRVLRRLRDGMTLETLAGLSGLSKSFLSKVENGKLALDRRSHIAAVAAALRERGEVVFADEITAALREPSGEVG